MAFGDLPTFGTLFFSPQSGPTGTKVTVTTDVEPVTGILLNNQPMPYQPDFSNGTYFFILLSTATSGKIKVLYSGGSITSSTNFTVTVAPPVSNAPKINSFTPTSGGPNTRVSVMGQNLANTIEAKIGTKLCFLQSATPTLVVFDVAGDVQTGRISLSGSDGTAMSATDFVVPATVSQAPKFMVSETQPVPEPVPLIDGETEPDFDAADTSAILRLVAGQSKTFRLVARRLDMMSDTVTTKVTPTPPAGLSFILPGQVTANQGFDVTVQTMPILQPGLEYVFVISGKGMSPPFADYDGFQLDVEVTPPVVFELPAQVDVVQGTFTEFKLFVIRRRYLGPVEFSFPQAAQRGITVTKTLVASGPNPGSQRGGIKDEYKVRFDADPSFERGLYDFPFLPVVVNAFFAAPASIRLNLIDLGFVIISERSMSVTPGNRATFKYRISPNAFRGALSIGAEVTGLEPGNVGRITTNATITLNATSSADIVGDFIVNVDANAVADNFNVALTLRNGTGAVVGNEYVDVDIVIAGVVLQPNRPDFSFFPGAKAQVEVDFMRAPNFTGDFIFAQINGGEGLTTTFNGDRLIKPTIRGKTVTVVAARNYTEGDTELIFEPQDPVTKAPVGKRITIKALKRRTETILRWGSGLLTIPQRNVVPINVGFGFGIPYQDPSRLAIGSIESFSVDFFLRDKPTKNLTTIFRIHPRDNFADTIDYFMNIDNDPPRFIELTISDRQMGDVVPECYEVVAFVELRNSSFTLLFEVVVPLSHLGGNCEGLPAPPPTAPPTTPPPTPTPPPVPPIKGPRG